MVHWVATPTHPGCFAQRVRNLLNLKSIVVEEGRKSVEQYHCKGLKEWRGGRQKARKVAKVFPKHASLFESKSNGAHNYKCQISESETRRLALKRGDLEEARGQTVVLYAVIDE
jgi:hypothetical protein